mgnify:CR=1 FL=1
MLAETPPCSGSRQPFVPMWSAVGDSGAGPGGRAVPDDALARRPGGRWWPPAPSARRPRSRSPPPSSTTPLRLIRGLLAAGRGPVTVRATRFTAPLVSPLSRTGWTDDEEAHPDDHDDRDPRLRGRTLGGVRLHRAADTQPAAVPAAHRAGIGGRAAQRRGGADDRSRARSSALPWSAGRPATTST